MVKLQVNLQFFELIKDVFENQWIEYGRNYDIPGELILHNCDVTLDDGDDYEEGSLIMFVVKI